jgi:hypothetical protein
MIANIPNDLNVHDFKSYYGMNKMREEKLVLFGVPIWSCHTD